MKSTSVAILYSIVVSHIFSITFGGFSHGFPELSAESKKNVILIVCDDLNDYISEPGAHPQAIAPNLKSFAKSAVRFSQAYSNNPVCAPSRASFLTGIYPHTSMNLFWGNWTKNPTLKNSKSMMAYFRDNGYHVVGTGKLMHHHVKSEWSEFKNQTDYGPYWFNGKDRVAHPSVPKPFNDIGCIDGSFASLGDVPKGAKGSGWVTGWGPAKLLDFSEDNPNRDLTADEKNAKWAIQKIKEFEKQKNGKPFFLGLGFVRPHTPLHVPQKYFDMFPENETQLPILKENDKDDTYLHVSDASGKESKGIKYFELLKKSYPNKLEGIKAFTRAYLASVAAVDDCIGQVIKALDASPLKENTIVVVTSDHGFNMGEKDFVFKNSLWEESTRVPMIVRAPGVSKAGSVVTQPVSLIDIYPTLKDLCGLTTDTRKNNQGAKLDGHSMRPLLKDPSSTWEGPDAALTMVYTGPQNNNKLKQQHWSIRTEQFRYIRYNNGKEELYDHKNDKNEWSNLAEHPEYKSVKDKLYAKLDQMLPKASPKSSKEKPKSNEYWKDLYFKRYPAADTNKDGQLSWAEFNAHKKAAK
jgi:iduronate 2-sulfatase